MAYTLTNLTDDIRNYTEVDDGVLTTAVVIDLYKMQKIEFTEK